MIENPRRASGLHHIMQWNVEKFAASGNIPPPSTSPIDNDGEWERPAQFCGSLRHPSTGRVPMMSLFKYEQLMLPPRPPPCTKLPIGSGVDVLFGNIREQQCKYSLRDKD